MDSEISCFDREDDVLNSKHKILKLPIENSNGECSGVYHASIIPRKMRSAMKKRKSQSISPTPKDSKNQNKFTCGRSKRCKKESTRKLKANQEQGIPGWFRKQILPGPITKDEAQVAETLYALAWMFSSNDSTRKEGVESSLSKPSTLPKATKDTRQELFTGIDSRAVLSNTSLERAFQEHNSQQGPASVDRKHFNIEAKDSVSQANIHISLWSKCGCSDDKLSYNTSNTGIPSHLSVDSRLNQLRHTDNSYQDGSFITKVTVTEIQLLEQQNIMGKEDSGPATWLGLSTTGSSSSENPLQKNAKRYPTRFNSSLFPTRSELLQTSYSTGKVSKAAFHRMSKRRCAIHVYISHLIELLQTTERNDGCLLSQDHTRGNALDGGTSTTNIGNSNTRRDCSEGTSGLAKRRQNWDRQNTSMSSWFYSQKQTFDFLSLSMASAEVQANTCNSGHREGREKTLEAESQVDLPQKHGPLPLSTSQTQYPLAYGDQLSTITLQQLDPYFDASGSEHPHPQHSGSGISITDQNVQVVPATQLTSEHSSRILKDDAAQMGWWVQSGGHDSSKLIPCHQAQATVSPSALSLEVEAHAPEYTPTSQRRLITLQYFPLPR